MASDPYCGPAPLPENLLSQWNLDPVLLAAIAIGVATHALVLHRDSEWRARRISFVSAWLIMVALFVTPLCALSSALFSVRVAHHVVLVAVVAPVFATALPSRWRAVAIPSAGLGAVFLASVSAMWLWHAPAAYERAMADHAVFWAMQLSLLVSALALWVAVLSPATSPAAALTLLLGSVIQMGLLGALITFARVALYLPHFATTMPYGLSALADQQLAGLIMWVPATLPYALAALVLLGRRVIAATAGRTA